MGSRDLFGEVPEPPKRRGRARRAAPAPVNPPMARKHDPSSAHESAKRIVKRAGQLDDRILEFTESKGYHGTTTLEFTEETGLERTSISSRFTQLEKAGRLWRRDLGKNKHDHTVYESRIGSKGMPGNIWRSAKFKPTSP